MISALVFLISLPLTVYALGGCLALIDQQDPVERFRALLRLAFRVVLFALLTLAAPEDARLWILVGVVTAIVLTLTGQITRRYLITSGRWPTERID